RFPTDRAYFIAKELLTTERTYLKDLEVMTVVRQACLLFGLPHMLVHLGRNTLIILVWLLRCSTTARSQRWAVTQKHFGRSNLIFFIHSPDLSSEMHLSILHKGD
ncbi:hypothetical protein GOODEAATRI_030467, partial [Goodea atripinnis]